MSIASIAQSFFETSLVDGCLVGVTDAGDQVNTRIQNIWLSRIEQKYIDETNDEQFFPAVLFQEGQSSIVVHAGNQDNEETSPQYQTPLQIFVFADKEDDAKDICYAVQRVVYRGLAAMRKASDITLIDAILLGNKSIYFGLIEGTPIESWQAFRSIIITNRIEP